MRRFDYLNAEKKLSFELEKGKLSLLQSKVQAPQRERLILPDLDKEKRELEIEIQTLAAKLLEKMRFLKNHEPEIAIKVGCSRKELKKIIATSLNEKSEDKHSNLSLADLKRLQAVEQALHLEHLELIKKGLLPNDESLIHQGKKQALPNTRPHWLPLNSYPPILLPAKKLR